MLLVTAGLMGCKGISAFGGLDAAGDSIGADVYEVLELPEIKDMSDAYAVILQGASKEYIAGYAVDENFLMWLTAQKGNDVILQLAWSVLDADMDVNNWYELTGESIHVLWLRYCSETGIQSYQLENVLWMECASPKETVISFTGDFNFAENWHTMEGYREKQNELSNCITPDLISIMQDSDILFMNNEFVYSDSTEPLPGKGYTFRADLDRIELLQELGADIVSLANNHTYDFGEEGLLDTMEVLDDAGIAYVGAGKNIEDAGKIVYMVANGKKIAFVSATEIERYSTFTKEATATEPGVLKTLNPQRFIGVIEQAEATSDYVIVVPHWGMEGILYADAAQKRLAELFIEAGADVIMGGHAHRLQGMEYYGEVPVIYSLGNFWFSTGTLYTTIAQVIISSEGDLQIAFVPCEQKDLTTGLLTDKTEKDEFYHYLASISTNVVIDAEGNVYDKVKISEDDGREFPYDSATSTTTVTGGIDNDGVHIDHVGNRW